MTTAAERLGRRPPPPIPILVLTGFLGAGKTTLLNGWIRSGALANAAVVINEFGDVPIDHLLVEQIEGTMLTLSSGCLCCSVRGDLVDTLEDLIRRRDNGRIMPFDRLVVETTGLADPAPVLNAIMAHPYLPLRYRVESVVTAVDALHGGGTLDRHAEARSQVAMADTILLTKTDLMTDPVAQEVLAARLAALNPMARLLDVAAGAASAEVVLAGSLALSERPEGGRRTQPEPQGRKLGAHDHGPGHHHHHGIDSLCLTHETPLNPATLTMFLDLVRGTHGPKLLRLKGLVALSDDPDRPRVIHAVQHVLHPAHQLDGWPDADRRSRLVFILHDLDPAVIRNTWAAFFGPPAPDQPDGAGLLAGAPWSSGSLLT